MLFHRTLRISYGSWQLLMCYVGHSLDLWRSSYWSTNGGSLKYDSWLSLPNKSIEWHRFATLNESQTCTFLVKKCIYGVHVGLGDPFIDYSLSALGINFNAKSVICRVFSTWKLESSIDRINVRGVSNHCNCESVPWLFRYASNVTWEHLHPRLPAWWEEKSDRIHVGPTWTNSRSQLK